MAKQQQWMSSGMMGAAFLMATSAIGPGFITQTTVFTSQQLSNFGFVILVSILIDIVVQLNIWKAIAATGLKAPALANRVMPGAGVLLTLMVVAGGMVFNIGNVAGSGLGLQTMFGISATTGAIISGVIAIALFLLKEFGKAMDAFAKWLGILMIVMVLTVAFATQPPVGDMLQHVVLPTHINSLSILTLVGGTVGGYISFAGAHRMLEAQQGKPMAEKEVTKGAVTGIILSGIMRIGLYAAVLGVVVTGFVPDAGNPAASVFQQALGDNGRRIFGLILWSAAITSVVGASYTSVSFLESWHPAIVKHRQWMIVAFIIVATAVFAGFGNPVKILVLAGAVNAFVLPLALILVLLAISYRKWLPNYRHPLWLSISGWVITALLLYMAWRAIAAL